MSYNEKTVGKNNTFVCRLRIKVSQYGFVECSTLLCFLHLFCEEKPGLYEMLYIRGKLNECLEKHDDGSSWFKDLRAIKKETDDRIMLCKNLPEKLNFLPIKAQSEQHAEAFRMEVDLNLT